MARYDDASSPKSAGNFPCDSDNYRIVWRRDSSIPGEMALLIVPNIRSRSSGSLVVESYLRRIFFKSNIAKLCVCVCVCMLAEILVYPKYQFQTNRPLDMTQTIGSPAVRMEPCAIIREIFQRLTPHSLAGTRAGCRR